jgi:hypothetical protein
MGAVGGAACLPAGGPAPEASPPPALLPPPPATLPGLLPQLHTWDLAPDGSGVEAHLAALAAAAPPGSPPAPPSDALLLRLPEAAGASEVEAAVAGVVARLLPALGYDNARDVQARLGALGWGVGRGLGGRGPRAPAPLEKGTRPPPAAPDPCPF